jgi:hypothetical protein
MNNPLSKSMTYPDSNNISPYFAIVNERYLYHPLNHTHSNLPKLSDIKLNVFLDPETRQRFSGVRILILYDLNRKPWEPVDVQNTFDLEYSVSHTHAITVFRLC